MAPSSSTVLSWVGLRRLLYGVFLLGTTASVALWIAVLTARCEGFGCLGVGAMVGMVFVLQLACGVVGGILIGWERSRGKIPWWLVALEILHSLPVLWFSARMMLS